MDIHQIMQSIGQILYLCIQAFGSWVQELSGYVGLWLQNIDIPSSPTMMKIFSNTTANRIIFIVAALYIAVVNIWAFVAYGLDKRYARLRKTRIPERTLLRLCIWGGGAGSLLGMLIFSHKTKDKKFNVSVPVLFCIQLIVFSFTVGFLGFWAFF